VVADPGVVRRRTPLVGGLDYPPSLGRERWPGFCFLVRLLRRARSCFALSFTPEGACLQLWRKRARVRGVDLNSGSAEVSVALGPHGPIRTPRTLTGREAGAAVGGVDHLSQISTSKR